ncbi:12048_t:CDS:1 [Ambispora gerdemannii]|uniref:12048_t:CDS:1 n=1 Tax=Ambispora gerdemannii TaxID=144530 RepID=A0A9N9F4Q3_9GLOM|nr:12048_t:CDS:1 [Ambispora gerdemannii]
MTLFIGYPLSRAQKRKLERNAANATKTLRPLNSFFHYRGDVQPVLRKQYPTMNERLISKLVSISWKKASAEVKQKYTEKAARAAIEHRKRHPEYVFRPRRTKPLNPKRISVRFGPTFSVNSSTPLKVEDVQAPVGNQINDLSKNNCGRPFMLIQYIPQENENKLLEECVVSINDCSQTTVKFSKIEDTKILLEKDSPDSTDVLSNYTSATNDQEIMTDPFEQGKWNQKAADEMIKFHLTGEIDNNLLETNFDIPIRNAF